MVSCDRGLLKRWAPSSWQSAAKASPAWPRHIVTLLLLSLLSTGCALDEPSDSQEPPKNTGSSECNYVYSCGTAYDAVVDSDRRWRIFVDCACEKIDDLIIRNVTTFSGKSAALKLVNGNLKVNSTALPALAELDENGDCIAGLCNIEHINGGLRVVNNSAMTIATLPELELINDYVSIKLNPELTHVDLQTAQTPGSPKFLWGAKNVSITLNDKLESLIYRGRFNLKFEMFDNSSNSAKPFAARILWNDTQRIISDNTARVTVRDNDNLESFEWLADDETPLYDAVTTTTVKISDNAALKTVRLPETKTISGSLIVRNNPVLESFTADSKPGSTINDWADIQGDFHFTNNGAAGANMAFSLPTSKIIGQLVVAGNPSLTELSLDANIIEGPIVIGNNATLNSLVLNAVAIGRVSSGASTLSTGLFVGFEPVLKQLLPNPALTSVKLEKLELVGHREQTVIEDYPGWYADINLQLNDADDVVLGDTTNPLYVRGHVTIKGMSGSNTLDLSALKQVGFKVNGALINSASDVSYGGELDIPWSASKALGQLEVVYGGMVISELSALSDLGLSSLAKVGHLSALLNGKRPLGLQILGATVSDMQNAFPALTDVGPLLVSGTAIDAIDFPEITTVNGPLRITQNDLLLNASMPKLTTVTGPFVIDQNGDQLPAGNYTWLHPLNGAGSLCDLASVAPDWCARCDESTPPSWCTPPSVGDTTGFAGLVGSSGSTGSMLVLNNVNSSNSGGLPWCWAQSFASLVPGENNIGGNYSNNSYGEPCVAVDNPPCYNGKFDIGESCDASVNCTTNDDCRTEGFTGAICEDGTCLPPNTPDCPCGGVRSCSVTCSEVILECTNCCGNGIIDTAAGEACDPGNPGASPPVPPKFAPNDECTPEVSGHAYRTDGKISCTEECEIDASACYGCWDGVVQSFPPANEECDIDSGGTSCTDLTYLVSGPDPNSNEDETVRHYDGGELRCYDFTKADNIACTFDVSRCFSICDNLVHHYRFEEEVNRFVFDGISGKYGTVQNASQRFTFDVFSEAVTIEQSPERIELPMMSGSVAGAGTISFHVYPVRQGPLSKRIFFAGSNFQLELTDENQGLQLGITYPPFVTSYKLTNAVLEPNLWQLFTFTWSDTEIIFYIDGIEAWGIDVGGLPFNGPLEFEKRGGAEPMPMSIDEVMIWDKALDAKAVDYVFRNSGRAEGPTLCKVKVCGDEAVALPNSLGVYEQCDGETGIPNTVCTAPGTVDIESQQLVDCKLAKGSSSSSSSGAGGSTGSGPGATTGSGAGGGPTDECGDDQTSVAEGCDPPGSPCTKGLESGTCGFDCNCEVEESFCGDGRLGPGEGCDGARGHCPIGFSCNPATCACQPSQGQYCPNGLVEFGEECDSSSVGCKAGWICGLNCRCEPLFLCGNGNIDPGEDCDPPNSVCYHKPTQEQQEDWDGDGICDGSTSVYPICNSTCSGCEYPYAPPCLCMNGGLSCQAGTVCGQCPDQFMCYVGWTYRDNICDSSGCCPLCDAPPTPPECEF